MALFANVLNLGGNLYYSLKKSERTVGIDPSKNLVFVTDSKASLLIYKVENYEFYEFTKNFKEAALTLIIKKDGKRIVFLGGRKIATGTSNKAREFICPLSSKSTNKNLSKLSFQIEDIVSAGNANDDVNFDSLIDDSCRQLDSYPQIKKVVSSSLSIEDNPILKCFSDSRKKTQLKEVASQKDLLELATEAVQNSNSNKFPTVSCKEGKGGEKELFANYSSNRITLFTDGDIIREDVCNPMASNMLHEYLHHLKGGEKSESLESLIKDIEKICWVDFGGDPLRKDQCSINEQEAHRSSLAAIEKLEADSEASKGRGFTATNVTLTNNEIKLEDNETAQLLVQSIPQASFESTQLSNSGWSSIADAKPGTVPPAARQVIQAANASFSSIGKIADQAFALLTKEAQATTPSKLSSSSQPGSQAAAIGSSTGSDSRGSSRKLKDGDFNTVEEYLVGDPKPKNTGNGKVSAVAQPSPNAPAPINQATRSKTGITEASEPRANSNGSTEIAGSVGSSGTTSTSAANVPQNFKPKSRSAGSSSSRQSGSSRQPASAQDGVQLLTVKTEVSGQDYRLIRRLYNDQSFKADLINRRIHIKTRAATLGVDPSRAKHVFEDDGTKLKKIGGQ